MLDFELHGGEEGWGGGVEAKEEEKEEEGLQR